MKRGLWILLIALVIGICAYQVTRSHRQAADDVTLLDSMPELAWLRDELKLNDAQFAKAGELHVAYRPQCVEMCRRISDAHAKVEVIARSSRGITPELELAIREHARVRAECQEKMLAHLYQTAELMDGDQAARYLEMVLPSALGSAGGHTGGHAGNASHH